MSLNRNLHRNGFLHALVVGAAEMPARSAVILVEINGAANLDQKAPFEYHQYVLKIEKSDGMTILGQSRNGSFASFIISNVQCKIIGNR